MTNYVVEYCFCALVFLLVILWNCLTTRQFPGLANRIFLTVLFMSILNVTVDVTGAYIIPLALKLPYWINYVVNTTYYALQLAIPAALLFYVLAKQQFRLRTMPWWQFIPFVVGEMTLLTNPLHKQLFHIDPVLGYQRGVLFPWLYAVCVLYIVLSFIMLNLYRKRINARQHRVLFLCILIVTVAATVQFLNPMLLLSGPAIAISITMLYLNIQKPENMLDQYTGVFNRAAMIRMVEDYIADRWRFQAVLLPVKYATHLEYIMGYESLQKMMGEIAVFLMDAFPNGWVFRLSETPMFVVITRRNADYEAGLQVLRARLARPWLAGEYDILLHVEPLCVPQGELARTADEFARVIRDAADSAAEGGVLLDETAFSLDIRKAYIEKAIDTALREDRFEVYLQPIYDLRSQSFSHAEALIRLKEGGQPISPAEFIPVAEKNGAIIRVDTLVLRKVCAFLRDGEARGLRVPECVSVNLSAVEFARPDIAEDVLRVTREYSVDPRRIMFEMTETAAGGPTALMQTQIHRMKAFGFSLALDDFGTGYANITQVMQLPFDMAKLDRSLLLSGKDGSPLLKSCAGMFRDLGIRVVAEGAETAEDVALLDSMGVGHIQGFYFARPMPMDEIHPFLDSRKDA